MSTDQTAYAAAGVDEEREQLAFDAVMRPLLKATRAASPLVKDLWGLATGHFATVMTLASGGSMAITTDGVGTKILIARTVERYEGIGVDCVANNVNDLICVGADPVLLLDYIAIDRIDERVLEELARGLARGADEAGIAIAGGEIAQVASLLASHDDGRPVFDIVGTALGVFPPGRQIVDGAAVAPGDVVVGLPSTGLHSNGYTLARHALFETAGLRPDEPFGARTLADALLEPTRIYVRAVASLWDAGIEPRGMVHISGGGLLNLSRLAADVSYSIDTLPDDRALFDLVQRSGSIPDAEMFATFNMGVGLCIVVPEPLVAETLRVLSDWSPLVLGTVLPEPGRTVRIPEKRLVGRGDRFEVA